MHPVDIPGERGAPPYFAGREKELAELHRRLRLAPTPNGRAAGMTLVTGVPGIGKTQLGMEFARQAKADWKAVVFNASTGCFDNSTTLFLDIGDSLGARADFEKVAGVAPGIMTISAQVAGTGGSVGMRTPQSANAGLNSMLANTRRHPAWRHTVLVVMVDELQNIEPGGAANLRVLHEGRHGCPIFLVGIGLQHTRRVLSGCGISRCSGFALGLLSRNETHEAISKGAQALGANIPDTATESLAAASMDFPQHVNGYIRAAVEVCRERGGLESEDNLLEAHRRGDMARIVYYERRLAAMERADRLLPLIGHMMNSGQDAVGQSEARAVLRDDGELIDSAVAHGVLQQSPRGDLSFAMPSFANYMQEWYRSAASKH